MIIAIIVLGIGVPWPIPPLSNQIGTYRVAATKEGQTGDPDNFPGTPCGSDQQARAL
jgi:hypothetical protein